MADHNNNNGRYVIAAAAAAAAAAGAIGGGGGGGIANGMPQQIMMNNNNDDHNNILNNNNNNHIMAVESVGAGPNVAHCVPVVPRLQRDRPIWSRVVPSNACLPPPRSGAASVVVKGRLYMFGVSNILQ
jgi:hypothetical protein